MDVHPPFYISSRGHSATTWLSKAICKHPKMVCFHGCRSIPPYGASTVPDMTPSDFVAALWQCGEATQHEKIFGAQHGYNGARAFEACKNSGVKYSAVFRHPIHRINSLTLVRMGSLFMPNKRDEAIRDAMPDIFKHIQDHCQLPDVISNGSDGLIVPLLEQNEKAIFG